MILRNSYDFDNDGWPDILQVNGHVCPEIEAHSSAQTFKNPRLMYKNLGGGRFKDSVCTLAWGTPRWWTR